MPNRPGAQIRRATRQARQSLQQFTDESLARLRAAYLQASRDLGDQIERSAGSSSQISLQVLRDLRTSIDQRLDVLGRNTAAELNAALPIAAQLGSAPFAASISGPLLTRVNEDAVRFVQQFIAADGLQLSDRVARLGSAHKQRIGQYLESAIIQGDSASKTALDYLNRGQAVPRDVLAKREQASTVNVRKGVTSILTDEDAEDYRNATRVFRTEINRAHGGAYVAAAEQDPDVAGVRFKLGRGHPRIDICDMHAQVNRYGLGPGVYPTSNHPWPAHPETLSFVEVVYHDEITEEDRAGKEDRLAWLLRQAPGTQEAVLGSRKKRAALIDGHLRESQITTPWNILRERYEKQGINTASMGQNLRAPNASLVPAGATPHSALASIDPDIAPAVNRALNAITQVHGVAKLPKSVPVVANELEDAEARYVDGYHLSLGGRPREIGITRYSTVTGAPVPEFVFTHEFGHLLDFSAIGTAGESAALNSPLFAGLRSAWANTTAVRDIAALTASTEPGVAKFMQYLLKPEELWARSYSQWVALRSGDRDLLRGVDYYRKIVKLVQLQWAWDDFDPIAAGIDDLMRRLGWVQ